MEYADERRPEVALGLWWEVAAEPGFAFESDQEVATYLRIWLEEAFHAGGGRATGRREWTAMDLAGRLAWSTASRPLS